jgi:hypothetical protein
MMASLVKYVACSGVNAHHSDGSATRFGVNPESAISPQTRGATDPMTGSPSAPCCIEIDEVRESQYSVSRSIDGLKGQFLSEDVRVAGSTLHQETTALSPT